MRTILLHLPAYREPELIPTIKDALNTAEFPARLRFGICRQYNPEDKFDNLEEFKDDSRFKIYELHYTEAKGLPYARAIINEKLLTDEDFVLQLDAHHRFTENWDTTLISWYDQLKSENYNPLICGYLPYYNPFNDPQERVQQPWFSSAACFYPHGTIFIRPTAFTEDWRKFTKPVPARFLSGHFCFGPNKWAKEIKHDPDIYFSGEELNLTVRSYTHGYDLFHPHRVVIWHATMREERAGKLVWDDEHRRGSSRWWKQQNVGRAKIRQLLRTENNGFDLTGYDLGTVRTLEDYEKYAGICFKERALQRWTSDNRLAPNPQISDLKWKDSLVKSHYYLVNITRQQLPGNDYDSILVAFDDENGRGIVQDYIRDDRLKLFLDTGKVVHYEKMFLSNIIPKRVVYWGHSRERGWAERVELPI
jgi:glycosyltransferase involved in cell wall biosynthesis